MCGGESTEYTCGYIDADKVTVFQLAVSLRSTGLYPEIPQLRP